MSDENTTGQNQNQEEQTQKTELDILKGRASMMGISFSNNIGVDALKQKIDDKLSGKTTEPEQATQTAAQPNPLDPANPEGRVMTLREMLYAQEMKLVRVRITNLDPKKKDLPGEIITVANEYLGTVRKFIPFGEPTEEGWHVPHCIYNLLKNRKFLNIRTIRDRRTGTEKVHQSWAPEFAIEVLDPLSEVEIKQLAQAQIAAGSIETNAL